MTSRSRFVSQSLSNTNPSGEPTRRGVDLALRRVSRVFGGDTPVLDEIDLDMPAGQFLALLGPSGCGKSTLLRLVAALDHPTSGQVTVGGQAVGRGAHPAGDDLAFVFQEAHLLPWRTLLRNVELPLELKRVKPRERRARAMDMLGQVGLEHAHDRYPAQLSGGMQMRGSLARALVTEPQLLLLDEPFAALDEITRQRLDDLLYQLWRERRFTVLFVTHSIGEAVFLAQRAIMLSLRPARILADRAIDLPGERAIELRSTVEFSQHVTGLYQDLLAAESAESVVGEGSDG